jgi:hypothetical protein
MTAMKGKEGETHIGGGGGAPGEYRGKTDREGEREKISK